MEWEVLHMAWYVFVTNHSWCHCWNMQKGLEDDHSYPWGVMLQPETTFLLGSGLGVKKGLHSVWAWPSGHSSPDTVKEMPCIRKGDTVNTGSSPSPGPAANTGKWYHLTGYVPPEKLVWTHGTRTELAADKAWYPVTWVKFPCATNTFTFRLSLPLCMSGCAISSSHPGCERYSVNTFLQR